MAIQDYCINKSDTILNGIKTLDKMAKKIVLVVEEEKLIGVVTDGDVRRWILQNGNLDAAVENIMNIHPIFIEEHEIRKAKQIFVKHMIEALPVLNKDRRVVDILFWSDSIEVPRKSTRELENTPVVIMAGGKGTRLYPYTKVLPKPLIPIGEQTILERIMNKFRDFGCTNFYLTVNYKKNMIKAYLEDKREEVNITYVEEEKFLGTGGSLYLLKETLNQTFFLSNCDILVDADYTDIMKYHKQNGNKITMVTSLKSYTIPYGVITVANGGGIREITEKPEYNFQVNTGLYVLEPEIINEIPENEFYHITQLINAYVEKGDKVGVYPITEKSWLDMGEIKEMEDMINRLKVE